MDSLSGEQVKDIKELYKSMYKVEKSDEKPAEESISEVNFEEYFESLSEEKKKNFFLRAFDKYMQGPDYGNKRKKAKEDAIDKQVDDYVKKNKGNEPINKIKVDDDQSSSAVLTKKDNTKQEPITIKLPNGGTKTIYPASDEYKKIKSGELTTSKSDSDMTTDITNIKKNEKDGYSSTVEKPKVSAMGDSIEKIEKDTKDDLEKNTNPSGKIIPKPTKPLMTNSPAAKAGIPLDMRQKFANQNAAFQATKNKGSGYTKMDFIKDFPNSQTAKKFNKGQPIPGFSYKKNLKNSYEPYDILLDYVLSEGHADTVEEAHYVMTQMDAETIQTIIEKTGVFQDPKLNIKYPDQPKMTEKGKQILPNLPDPTIVRGNKVIYKPKGTPRIFGDPTGKMSDFFKS